MATELNPTRPTVTKCTVCGGIYDTRHYGWDGVSNPIYRIERHTSSNSAPFKCPGSDASL